MKKIQLKKFEKLDAKSGVILFLIASVGILYRLFYFPSDIPIVLDGLEFFTFAQEVKMLGTIPSQIQFANIGWPIFLSSIFSIVPFNDALSYMNLQRMLTVIISVSTIIPLYFLINKFFDKKYCFLGIIIFVFEPRIIQNSITGISDSLYILILTSAFALFFSGNRNMIMFSVVLSALSTYVRSEGIFIFVTLTILYFIQMKNEKNKILKFMLMVIIFVLILSPVIPWRLEVFFNEFINEEIEVIDDKIISNNLFITGLENFSKFFVWVMIPSFIVLVPPGILILLKKWNKETQSFIIPITILSIPVFYAYSIPALDTRYLLVLYPFFCLISLVFIKNFLVERFDLKKIFIIIVIGILISSIIFLEYKKIDQVHQEIAIDASKIIIDSPKIVNGFYPESSYISALEIIENWPDIPKRDHQGNYEIYTKVIAIDSSDNISRLLKEIKEKELTHLVIDNNKERPEIYKKIFENDDQYDFLIKEFDLEKNSSDYRVKIFKINIEE